MEIKPFDPLFSSGEISDILASFETILSNGTYVLGEFTSRMESEILKWHVGPSDAVLLSSGTSALECTFDYLHSIAGDCYVGVQSNTNFATVSSIIRAGLTPVFIDCDFNGQVSFADILKKHEQYSLRALAMVHIGGYISEQYGEISQFCKEQNVYLVEDAAHAHGSISKDGEIGSNSLAAILSFFPTKVVNGGEGGAVLTRSEELAKFCRAWRNQGKVGSVYGNDHYVLGGSNRMPELNCALGLKSFSKLASEINSRNEISSEIIDRVGNIKFYDFRYLKRFSNYKLIARINGVPGHTVESKLKQLGVFCGGAVYRTPCHKQPVFKDYQLGIDTLKNTTSFCEEHFCIPIHSKITTSQLSYMIDQLNKI